ncbi:MAG: HAMP domain-containing histidine kinase [Deltaproteobacteria bacterium]|nr:HAMP domain-containing histidine kinase [Deltaproteobacteria bacterium]
MNLTDEELIRELTTRFAQSRKAFSDLSVVNRKLAEMNRRLEQSESLKSNFLSNIRNEINNPLNAIIGLAGQLASRGEGEVAGLASMICAEANNLDFQLRNIFLAAELEAGDAVPHIVRVNVAAVVVDVVESFRFDASRKSVEIELELQQTDEPLLFTTDAEKLQVIVSNLLANAVEFSPYGDVITVFAGIDAEGQLVCAVCDSGMGIAEDDKKRIFDRFTQLETGTTRTHPGHGLGLSITRALTDLLQGTIAVDSMPGQGALFTVTLPARSISDDENIFAEGGNLFLFDEMSEK